MRHVGPEAPAGGPWTDASLRGLAECAEAVMTGFAGLLVKRIISAKVLGGEFNATDIQEPASSAASIAGAAAAGATGAAIAAATAPPPPVPPTV